MDVISWQQFRNLIRFANQRLQEMRLPQVAGSLTFTSVLALVPIVTVGLAILTAFPLFTSFTSSLEAYFSQNLMPRGITNSILGYLSQFATQARRLSAVGGVALMITAIATMATIDKTFNQIWKVKHSRPLLQRIVVYWAIVTLGPLLIGMSMSASSTLFGATSAMLKNLPVASFVFNTIISVGFTAAAYTLLYLTVPNRQVDWRDAAWGGLFAAVVFEIAKRLFAVFIKQFPTYTIIYGALAALPIFLLWVYLCWLITLFGAVITAALPVVKFERWWHVPAPGSAFEDAIAVLKVLIVARHSNGKSFVNVQQIREKTRFGIDEIEGLLEAMLEEGWVARVDSETTASAKRSWWKKKIAGSDRWILTMNPSKLALFDVYRLFVFDASKNTPLSHQVNQVIISGLPTTLQDYCLVRG